MEIWQYRELLYLLVWRDLKVRYKQSVLGIAWVVIQPLAAMLIFTIIFNRLLGVASESGVPYPIFVYSGLLPWMYFAGALSRCSTSVVNNANLVSKIYFPRMVIPIAAVLSGLVDLGVALLILVAMMIFYGMAPGLAILTLPFVLLLAALTALGVGLWLSALNVQYRDVQYIVPFVVQIWMYLTPVIYPISNIPSSWRWLYNLNPMVGVVGSFRGALLGDVQSGIIAATAIVIVALVVLPGAFYFRRMEDTFADVI